MARSAGRNSAASISAREEGTIPRSLRGSFSSNPSSAVGPAHLSSLAKAREYDGNSTDSSSSSTPSGLDEEDDEGDEEAPLDHRRRARGPLPPPASPPPSHTGRWILVGVVIVVLLGGTGVAIIFMLRNSQLGTASSSTLVASQASATPTATAPVATQAAQNAQPTTPLNGAAGTTVDKSSPASPSPDSTATTSPLADKSTNKTMTAPEAKTTGTSSSGDLSLLTTLGVTEFLGENSGIGRCSYNDSVPGFAPSVGSMLGNFGESYEKAATAYCGLEASFETTDGKTALLVIADGFDDAWVLSPGFVDIVYDSFGPLFGKTTTNKNDVLKDLKWSFTGVQRKQYTFEVCR